MISKLAFFYDAQVVEEKQPPAVIDGLKGRNKYIDYGDDGYRQIQTREDAGFFGAAVHWMTTITGIKPTYKITEYYCTDQGTKLSSVWNQMKDDLAPAASAERIQPELNLKDCELIQDGHPVHALPEETLCQIFSYLDLAEMSKTAQTCKAWKRVAETENAGLTNFHLNPVRIELEAHKAGTYRESERTQAAGATKVVRTIDLVKESDLDGNHFGVFFDPWNNRPGIAVRYISRSLNAKKELIETKAVFVALKDKKGDWTAKTIAYTNPLYLKNEEVDVGKRIAAHDPAKIFIHKHSSRTRYLKRLMSGKPCGGSIQEFSLYGETLRLDEGPLRLCGKPIIEISRNASPSS